MIKAAKRKENKQPAAVDNEAEEGSPPEAADAADSSPAETPADENDAP